MKILFWTDGFWPRRGGIETQSLQFIEHMQKRGHEYQVFAQKDSAELKDREELKGITIKRFSFNEVISKKEIKLLHSIQSELQATLREFQPDIIHLNANVGGSAFVFLLFIKMFDIPIVSTIYAPYSYKNKIPPIIEKLAHAVNVMCCISKWVLSEMKTKLPQIKSKLQLIYCGLPAPEDLPSPLSFSPPILLLLGRLSVEKGFATAIEAFSLLKKEGSQAKLVIAGDGPERMKLEKLTNELGLNNSVTFKGNLKEEEIYPLFNEATVVIVPSLIESFGLVILEAMQMSRPVIASRVEGIPEVVSEGETGLLVPMQNPVAFYEAIQQLLKDPEEAIRLGKMGRQKAIDHFTLTPYLTQYEALYRELQQEASAISSAS